MATSQNLATKLALRWGILPVGTLVFRGLNDISNLLITVQAAEASRPCNSMNDDTSKKENKSFFNFLLLRNWE